MKRFLHCTALRSEGCANEQSPKVAQASGLHVCLARNPEECATFSAQVVSTLGVR